MKVILFSDTHIHRWKEFDSTNAPTGSARLGDCINVLGAIRKVAFERGIKHVISAGDLFHRRGVLDVTTYNATYNALRGFKDDRASLWLMDGNHDQATKDGSVHSLESFKEIANVVKEGDIQVFDKSLTMAFFPYRDILDLTMRAVQKVAKKFLTSAPHVVGIMHHGFQGARVGSSLEYVVKEPLDPAAVSRGLRRVFSGHYHTRQELGKVTYIGAPLEHTRSDRGSQDRGFIIYDSEADSVEVVPLPWLPHFVTVTDGDIKDLGHTEIRGRVERNFIDITTNEDPDGVRNHLMQLGARGVKVIPVPKNAVRAEKRLEVDPSTKPEEVIRKYVKWATRENLTRLPRERLVAEGLRFLQKE